MNYPFPPLEHLARLRAFRNLDPAKVPGLTFPTINDVTDGMLAEMFEVDRKTIRRWRTHGLGQWKADEATQRVGLTPWDVWGDEWMRGALNDPAA